MKKIIFIALLLASFAFTKANNITISNISVLAIPSNTIKFDISWDNGWRSASANLSFDAAWVFFKYKDAFGNWNKLPLTNVGNIIPSGFLANLSDSTGATLYRSSAGNGTTTLLNVQLGITTTQASGIFDIKAFAVEMVSSQNLFGAADFIPGYYAGDGSSTNSYPITFFNAQAFLVITDPLATPTSINSTFFTSILFPNGYNSFTCMKYELSQGGYRDFLNSLTYIQQANHIVPAPNAATGTAALYNLNRNYIKIKTPGIPNSTPAVFGCDANGNGIFDEAADGEWTACNYLTWVDQAAYMAWAGLRPMSELEYEKIARGPQLPVAGEYVWGNANIFTGPPYYTVTNINQSSEAVSNAAPAPTGNAQYSLSYNAAGPLRNGLFATVSSNKITSGGGYYGVMEMSGNLWERVITTGFLNFRNIQGDAIFINSLGYASVVDAASWPGMTAGSQGIVDGSINATGLIYRGGAWDSPAENLRISDRSGLLVSNTNTDRINMANVGVRGCRSRIGF
jgi:formylglycine-generating enzyme required for sulfatase activity